MIVWKGVGIPAWLVRYRKHNLFLRAMIAEPRSTSSSIAGPPIPVPKPVLSELKLTIDEEEDVQDEEDENHLINILSKLKEAKKTLDSSKSK